MPSETSSQAAAVAVPASPSVFLTVFPSIMLPMFLAFPALLPRLGFWPTLAACVLITLVCFAGFARAVRGFGIELL